MTFVRKVYIADEVTGATAGIRPLNTGDPQGAINIHDLDNHRTIVQEPFLNYTGVTQNPSAPIAQNATEIVLVDATNFDVGDRIKVTEGTTVFELGSLEITVKSVNTITLDRKIDNAFTTAAVVEKVVDNMNVIGSLSAPIMFEMKVKPGKTIHLENVVISSTSGGTGVPDGTKFINHPAIVNGVVLREEKGSGVKNTLFVWDNNARLKLYCNGNSEFTTGTLDGVDAVFSPKHVDVVLNIAQPSNDKICIYIQDDLAALTTVTLKMIGSAHYTDE